MESSRRTFLKIAGISALGLSAKPVLDAFGSIRDRREDASQIELKKGRRSHSQKWAMVIDTTQI